MKENLRRIVRDADSWTCCRPWHCGAGAKPSRRRPPARSTVASPTRRAVCCPGSPSPRRPDTGYTRTAVTNEEGLFVLPLLPPGTYEVTVELTGFGTFKQPVRLTVGASITMNPTLQVARGRNSSPSARRAIHRDQRDRPHDDGRRRTRSTTCRSTAGASRTSSRSRRRCRSTPARPAVVCRPARHQRERQHRRRRLQPAVLRRHPRRRAIEQRVHDPAGSDPGIPGGRGRLLGGVRPLDRRPGQRHHEVGHQHAARLALLCEPQQGLGRAERLRPERRADAAAVRRLDRRPDLDANRLFYFARWRAAAAQEHAQRRLQPDRHHADAPTTPRRTTSSKRSRSRSTRPTTPKRSSAASTIRCRAAAA